MSEIGNSSSSREFSREAKTTGASELGVDLSIQLTQEEFDNLKGIKQEDIPQWKEDHGIAEDVETIVVGIVGEEDSDVPTRVVEIYIDKDNFGEVTNEYLNEQRLEATIEGVENGYSTVEEVLEGYDERIAAANQKYIEDVESFTLEADAIIDVFLDNNSKLINKVEKLKDKIAELESALNEDSLDNKQEIEEDCLRLLKEAKEEKENIDSEDGVNDLYSGYKAARLDSSITHDFVGEHTQEKDDVRNELWANNLYSQGIVSSNAQEQEENIQRGKDNSEQSKRVHEAVDQLSDAENYIKSISSTRSKDAVALNQALQRIYELVGSNERGELEASSMVSNLGKCTEILEKLNKSLANSGENVKSLKNGLNSLKAATGIHS